MKRDRIQKIASLMIAAMVMTAVFVADIGTAYGGDGYRFSMPRTIYHGKYHSESYAVYACKDIRGTYINVMWARSSDPSILKIEKSEYIANGVPGVNYVCVPQKSGKVKLTAKFKDEDGKVRKISRSIRVMKYPSFIKSLKVNGKKINLKQEVTYCNVKSKKVKNTIRFSLKKGWKKTTATGCYRKSNGDQVKISKKELKKILKGKEFSFPKKYKSMYVFVLLEKGEDFLDYQINIER